jgi:hypothetical protein
MKKWHLEGVLHRIASEKLVLPDSGQSAVFCPPPSLLEFREESKLVSCCRQIAAFFIRFF